MASRTLQVIITGKADKAVGAMKDTERAAGGMQSKLSKVGSSVAKALAVGGAASIAGAAVYKVGKGFYDAATESIKIGKQTAAVVKSTNGAAGVTADGVAKLSDKLAMLSGVDDEVIQSGQNMLLTFTNVRNGVGKNNDIFDQATKLALDYSVATGTDLTSANKQLGKALQDPVKGMAMLGRAGVTFTQSQKDQIKWMAASGDTMGAQRVILKEFSKEFGGSAAAQATAGDRLKVVWGNVQETIGKKLVPVVEKFANFLATNLPKVTKYVEEHGTAFKVAAGIVGGVMVAAMAAYAVSAASAAAATIAATWPILAVVAAAAALAAGLIYAYKHWGAFRAVVDTVARFIKGTVWPIIQQFARGVADQFRTMVSVVGSLMGGLRSYIINPVRSAVGTVKGFLGGMVSTFRGIPGRISSALSGVWSAITDPFRRAFDWIRSAASNLHIPSIGGLSIPGFATGTMSAPSGLAIVGERGPELVKFSGGERVYPASTTAGMVSSGRSIGGGGGGPTIVVNVGGSVVTERKLIEVVRDGLNEWAIRTGKPALVNP